jgi:hypothetical protein
LTRASTFWAPAQSKPVRDGTVTGGSPFEAVTATELPSFKEVRGSGDWCSTTPAATVVE